MTRGEVRIEGRNPVIEALKAGRPVYGLMVAKGEPRGSLREILRLAREKGVRIQEVPREVLDRRARSSSHQGVLALVAARPAAELDDILADCRKPGVIPLLVVAAGLQDPQNLGALIRCAEAVGAQGLVVSRHRSAPVTPAVLRASAGAAEHLPVATVTNVNRCLEELKRQGIWICGADPEAERTHYEADLTGPLALVVGGEGQGLPRLVLKNCDFRVRIPMRGRVNSLNVSAAAAVILYECLRQRLGLTDFTGNNYNSPVQDPEPR